MIIESVRLINYRNYHQETFDFSKGINVICGKNAQGKTNLIESLFFLARGYSHKNGTLKDLPGFDQPGFQLFCKMKRQDVSHRLKVLYSGQSRERFVDGQKAKQDQIAGLLNTILFEPDDLKIVKEGPDKRRRFIDQEISGYRPMYLRVLKEYQQVLSQRNALLKNIRYDASLKVMLETWNTQLIQYGVRLMQYRMDYLLKLNRNAQPLHHMMSDASEELTLYYQNNIMTTVEDVHQLEALFRKKINESLEEDLEKGSTRYGPHVDDMVIHINGRDARKFGSQGQQRTAAIALKLSQIEIYKESTGDYPIVLLDDILSELDEKRQQNILSILGDTQAFITTTDDQFMQHYCKPAQIITIEKGKNMRVCMGSKPIEVLDEKPLDESMLEATNEDDSTQMANSNPAQHSDAPDDEKEASER